MAALGEIAPTPDAHLRLHVAMLRLDTFTCRELADAAAVKLATTQDVLRDSDAVEIVARERGGGRGAPAHRYRLSERGRGQITARLRVLERLVPANIEAPIPSLARFEVTLDALEDCEVGTARHAEEVARAERDLGRVERAIAELEPRPGGREVAEGARARLALLRKRLSRLRQAPQGADGRIDPAVLQQPIRNVLMAILARIDSSDVDAVAAVRLLVAQRMIPTGGAELNQLLLAVPARRPTGPVVPAIVKRGFAEVRDRFPGAPIRLGSKLLGFEFDGSALGELVVSGIDRDALHAAVPPDGSPVVESAVGSGLPSKFRPSRLSPVPTHVHEDLLSALPLPVAILQAQAATVGY